MRVRSYPLAPVSVTPKSNTSPFHSEQHRAVIGRSQAQSDTIHNQQSQNTEHSQQNTWYLVKEQNTIQHMRRINNRRRCTQPSSPLPHCLTLQPNTQCTTRSLTSSQSFATRSKQSYHPSINSSILLHPTMPPPHQQQP